VTARTEWVAYGRPAAIALHAAVRAAKDDDPLSPVTVVVSSNHVGVATRRLLAAGTLGPLCSGGVGVAAVSFLTVYRLAELLGAAPLAARGRRPVSTPVLAGAVRGALRRRPGVFASVATHPATETALVAAYRELRDVSPGALDELARCGRRAHDVVRLFRVTRVSLEDAWYDEEDLITAAIAVLDAGGPRDLGSTVVYLPQRVSLHGARLLHAVASAAPLSIVAGLCGDERADAEVAASVARITGSEGPQRRPVVDAMTIVDSTRTRIVTTSDGDEEVRAAVRAVMDAVRRGTPLERIAVLYPTEIPYARLVHEQLAAAGIAANGIAPIPLTARVAGRTILGLLSLPDAGFRREDVFAWLAGARLRDDGVPVPTTAWERISRNAGVVSGRVQWDTLLARYAADRDAEVEMLAADPDAPEWRTESLRTEARRARHLRGFVLRLIDDLDAARAPDRSWAEQVAWARRALSELLGDHGARARWPLAEQKAAERVERAIERLGCLDTVEPAARLDVFARTLEAELEADLGRVGRMGEGVLTGSVSMGVGLDLDLIVVLGLAEGTFPAAPLEDSLLPDHERRATAGELPLRAEGVARQHRHLLASLTGAARHLLSVPRGDLRRSSQRVPSRWVTGIASVLAHERWWGAELLDAERPWIEHVASYDAGLRSLAVPADAQEHRLRALMAGNGAEGDQLDPVYEAGKAVVCARHSDRFTRFDGHLTGVRVPSPADRVMSATRLEGWATCPRAYLLRDLLGVEEVDNPEERLQISALDRGSLVHEALETFMVEVLARPAAQRPGPGDAWTDEDRRRMAEIAEALCDRYEARGLTGRLIFWRRDRVRIVADLVHVLELDNAERATHRTRPLAAELAFGLPGNPETVSLALPRGDTVRFRGKADRVDAADGGGLRVLDYKTGKYDAYRGLSEEDPDLGGTRLQLVVYGLAARQTYGEPDTPTHAEYWFTSRRGEFRHIGYPVTADVVQRVSTTVGRIVEGIEAGVFPAHPTAQSTSIFVECAYCDPDALGVTALRRDMDRKRADPTLSGFFALVDPGDDPAPEPDVRHAPEGEQGA
jgi:ATP-dependent helicase/nuclease subunit B